MIADLIPESFYVAQATSVLWLVAIGSIAVLVFAADRAVAAAAHLAKLLGLSTVIVGATVVSLGTTSPEAFVSVSAAYKGQPGLALGNGVGSIICDTALIFGLCCCLTRLPKDKRILNRHGWLQFGSAALLAIIAYGLAIFSGGFNKVVIPRAIGIFLIILLGIYLWLSIFWARKGMICEEVDKKPEKKSPWRIVWLLVILFGGLAGVAFSSQSLIGSVGEICLRLKVPESVLAVTLVAFGTSLPELVTAIMSIIRKHPGLLVGNIIGADILNVLFVVGGSAIASPLKVPVEFFYLHFPVMLIALGLFRIYIAQPGETFRRWQGSPLLGLFLAYYVVISVLMLTGRLSYTPG